jgi:formylglycine-generating enzyme required for sulfatase activity
MERIFYAILNEPLNLEPLRQAGAPESVCALVERCTLKRPEDRPQGMSPVCAELDRILEQLDAPTLLVPPVQSARPLEPLVEPSGTPSEPGKPPVLAGRRKWLLPAAVLVALALAGGIFLALRPGVHPPYKPTPPAPVAIVPQPPEGMVAVPAGAFLFGENRETVTLPAFFIDRTEVTNADYQKFCEATNHPLPQDFPKDQPNLPVVNVTIVDAQAFAKWAGKRLPTAREWEKAARGTDGRLFPWGNLKDPARADVGTGQIRPAEDFANGKSPYGALQMVGNVWELVDQVTTPSAQTLKIWESLNPKPDEPWYEMRGESFLYKQLEDGALWDPAKVPVRGKGPSIGFRCVRDAN